MSENQDSQGIESGIDFVEPFDGRLLDQDGVDRHQPGLVECAEVLQ